VVCFIKRVLTVVLLIIFRLGMIITLPLRVIEKIIQWPICQICQEVLLFSFDLFARKFCSRHGTAVFYAQELEGIRNTSTAPSLAGH
jgi:hypothetical protein